MRCLACNCVLEEHELRRKGLYSTEYIDLCDTCLIPIEDDIVILEEGILDE